MSRSYKKEPMVNDGHANSTKRRKRFANKKVRNTNDVPNGGSYKKVSESWEIHDFCWRWTWEEAKQAYESGENHYLQEMYPTLKDFYREWLKEARTK